MNKKQRLLYQIGKREYKAYLELLLKEYSKKKEAMFIREFQAFHKNHSMEYMRDYNKYYHGGSK